MSLRVVRFLDEQGRECVGELLHVDEHGELPDGHQPYLARLLSGSVETGFHHITDLHNIRTVKQFLAPVQPASILCIGLNYREHASETEMKLPSVPVVFMKHISAATGHEQPIVIPKCVQEPEQIDYEAELVVIIGKHAKNVPKSEALKYVAGYCIGHDVSARDEQLNPKKSGSKWFVLIYFYTITSQPFCQLQMNS
jgi:2-keto-4-pentenoate hydratase/2-oxohepta-3-ene-1,7-dioic acid hydratase in catechol pathway